MFTDESIILKAFLEYKTRWELFELHNSWKVGIWKWLNCGFEWDDFKLPHWSYYCWEKIDDVTEQRNYWATYSYQFLKILVYNETLSMIMRDRTWSESCTIALMATSPDLIPIEHIWYTLGKHSIDRLPLRNQHIEDVLVNE